MLLRTAQKYGVRVQSLQHVLEGYKVAAEIAAHGASASTFSDWWAYKIEAYDAIPYNAALLTEAGASVCIKSDDAELMRHLNLEAAKMVKYGGVSESQALAMITINPARELGLDGRLGSIEVGKDADIVLFNGHPFDAFSRCELALIDGEVFFQRHEPGGGFGARPGDHTAMPAAAESVRNRSIEIAAQPKNLFALVGANLHPVAGPEIKGGTLVIAAGKIAAIGPAGTPIPPEAQTIEMSGPGHLAGHGRRRIDDRPVRGRQPDRNPRLGRRRPVSARAAQQHRASPRQRAHSGHAGQRHLDVVRRADRRHDLGTGMPDRLERLGAARARDRRSGRPGRDDPRVHPPQRRIAQARPGSGTTRPGPRGRSGGERGARTPQGTAGKDQGDLPQSDRLRHGRRQGTRPRRSSADP